VLNYARLERFDMDKHSSLLGPFIIYLRLLNTAELPEDQNKMKNMHL
jgi:hypothetical protein